MKNIFIGIICLLLLTSCTGIKKEEKKIDKLDNGYIVNSLNTSGSVVGSSGDTSVSEVTGGFTK